MLKTINQFYCQFQSSSHLISTVLRELLLDVHIIKADGLSNKRVFISISLHCKSCFSSSLVAPMSKFGVKGMDMYSTVLLLIHMALAIKNNTEHNLL